MIHKEKVILTIGTFDGVHRGHQYLFSEMVRLAKEENARSLVITYNRHPLETISNQVFPYLLTEKSQKESLIHSMGIDHIEFLDFNREMSQYSARKFLQDYIIQRHHPDWIVCGYDTHFGFNREGNTEFLKKQAHRHHYQVLEVDALSCNQDIIVSSSLIRDLIRKGMVDNAFTYLGYYYSLRGQIITGKKIGRTLGFPTMNLKLTDKYKLIPDSGVYITISMIDEQSYFGLTNIGVSPSIKTENIVEVETHLLDFNGDLYHKEVQVFFMEKIRSERKFNTKAELISQIEKDISYTRNYLMGFKNFEGLK